MRQRSLTTDETSALLTELRAMALLPPGLDEGALMRAREICALLQAQQSRGRTVAQTAARALSSLEILLSRRRWKQEAASIEVLRKQIKMACDQLRVTVESAFSLGGGEGR